MRTCTVLGLAVSIAVVVIASRHQPAMAQGSPPIPTGGGSAYQVPVDYQVIPDYRKPTQSWSSLESVGRLLAQPLIAGVRNRSWTPIAHRQYWWGGKPASVARAR